MTDEPRRIPVVDKRVSSRPEPGAAGDASAPEAQAASDATTASDGSVLVPEGIVPDNGDATDEQNEFLDDLRRLQADFDNYRKRMMREQAATAQRAKARLIEQMLPVLDAFDQALDHEDAADGLELIYKQFKTTLETEGLEEIPAEGVPFDPHVHEAVDSREDPDVDEIVCRSVYRRGYRFGDQMLRAAMVVVARPPETGTGEDAPEAAEG